MRDKRRSLHAAYMFMCRFTRSLTAGRYIWATRDHISLTGCIFGSSWTFVQCRAHTCTCHVRLLANDPALHSQSRLAARDRLMHALG